MTSRGASKSFEGGIGKDLERGIINDSNVGTSQDIGGGYFES